MNDITRQYYTVVGYIVPRITSLPFGICMMMHYAVALCRTKREDTNSPVLLKSLLILVNQGM